MAEPLQVITHTRGNLFRRLCTWTQDGVGVALTSAPKSQIRDRNDELIADLVVTLVTPQTGENVGKFFVECADTSTWPVGPDNLRCDIVRTDASGVTRIFSINVLRGVTR